MTRAPQRDDVPRVLAVRLAGAIFEDRGDAALDDHGHEDVPVPDPRLELRHSFEQGDPQILFELRSIGGRQARLANELLGLSTDEAGGEPGGQLLVEVDAPLGGQLVVVQWVGLRAFHRANSAWVHSTASPGTAYTSRGTCTKRSQRKNAAKPKWFHGSGLRRRFQNFHFHETELAASLWVRGIAGGRPASVEPG